MLRDETPDPGWHGIGQQVELTPGRQQAARDEFERRVSYAIKSETHLWIVTLAHYASDQLIEAMAGNTDALPLLDTETLAFPPVTGCYVCEEPYDRRLRHRKCKGDPS